MDAAHKLNLERILGNRERRGVRQPTPKPEHLSPRLIRGNQHSGQSSPQSLPAPLELAERQHSAHHASIYQSPTKQHLPPKAPQYAAHHSASPVQPEAGGVSYQEAAGNPDHHTNRSIDSSRFTSTGIEQSNVYSGAQDTSASRRQDPKDLETSRATNSLLSQQNTLTKQQITQQKQLDSMQSELRSGLANVNSTLQNLSIQQQQQNRSMSSARMNQFQADSGSLTSRIDGLQQQGILGRGAHPSYTGQRSVQLAQTVQPRSTVSYDGSRGGSDASPGYHHQNQHREILGNNKMMRNIPAPVEIDHMTGSRVVGARRTPKPLNRGFKEVVTEREAQDYDNAVANAPRDPGPLPHNATPYSSSTIDIDSSVTVLRSGDWFLKWNDKGNQVRPKYIWLDTQKNIISWGKDRGTASLMAGYVKIEEIFNVTTTQMSETGADDIPRVYYILLLHTPRRTLQLATEKREKLDQWYDALNNIAMFYRVRGSMTHSHDPSTE